MMRELALNEIEAAARGCVRAEAAEGGVRCLRFHPAAREHYARREAFDIRARCPSGVCLDFFSDTASVSIAATIARGPRASAIFDLWADGQFAAYAGGADVANGPFAGSMVCGAGKKERRIQLYLPHSRQVEFKVKLCEAASFAPAPRRPVWLSLGDSITQGCDSLHPSQTYAAVCARELGFEMFDYGIGGEVFDAANLPVPPIENPAGISAAYGTNDWNSGFTPKNAESYFRRVRELYPQTPLFCLLPLWRTKGDAPVPARNSQGLSIMDYRAAIAEIARSLPNIVVAGYPELIPAGETFLADGVHPNTFGHMVYGLNLSRLIRRWFAANGSALATFARPGALP